MIAAIEKAKSLYQYACASGAPLDDFRLILTRQEAFELLDDMAATCYEKNELFELDVAEAHAKGDPWLVLENFTCHGLKVVSAEKVLQ